MFKILLTISFIVGSIPAMILFVMYGFGTKWQATSAGRVVFALVTVIMTTYLLTALTLLFPKVLGDSGLGGVVRLSIRVAVDVVLWALLWLFRKAQREADFPRRDSYDKT